MSSRIHIPDLSLWKSSWIAAAVLVILVVVIPGGLAQEATEEEPAAIPAADPEIAVPPIAVVEPDPALVELRAKMRLLVEGQAPETLPIDSMFSVALDRLEPVRNRSKLLKDEVTQLEGTIELLERRMANPEAEIPAPAEPDILQNPPVEPIPPVKPEPAPPIDKPAEAPAGAPPPLSVKPPKEESSKTPAAPDKLPEEATAPPEVPPEDTYENLIAEYEASKLAFETAQVEYAKVEAEFQVALEDHRAHIEEFLQKTEIDLVNSRVRLEIARDRSAYLTALESTLASMTDQARLTFATLGSKHAPLHDRSTAILSVKEALERLEGRLVFLTNRTEAGSLLGFREKRLEVIGNLEIQRENLKGQIASLNDLATKLETLAANFEASGAHARWIVFSKLLAPDSRTFFDRLFFQHLDEQRRLDRLATDGGPFRTDLPKLVQEVDQLVSRPGKIGTVTDAQQALLTLATVGERIDSLLLEVRLSEVGWKQAHERELTTIFRGLASEKARRDAYTLSAVLIRDLPTEAGHIWTQITTWFASQRAMLADLPIFFKTRSGWLWFGRVLLIFGLVTAAFTLRTRMRSVVTWIVRRLNGTSFFGQRIGMVVRVAGLLQAIIPILFVIVIGYGALALAGFAKTEVQFIEVAFRWIALYLLGLRTLIGITRQVSRSRPALVRVSQENVTQLRHSYSRLGLMVVLVAIVDEWSRGWLGASSLSAIVRIAALIWLTGWIIWAAFIWRIPLARTWSERVPENGYQQRTAKYMEAHAVGVLFFPISVGLLIFGFFRRTIRNLLAQGGVLSYLRAVALRRQSKRIEPSTDEKNARPLPEQYVKEFPLYPISGDEGSVLVPREAVTNKIIEQLESWRSTRQDGSVALVGEKGNGKTTLLALLERQISTVPVIRDTISRKALTEKDLVNDLSEALGLKDVTNVGMLASHLNNGEDCVILLDEAHNVFLRKVDGYQAFEALVRLVNYTSEHVFWVLVFNSFAWEFINQSQGRVHYFRRLLYLPQWSVEDIRTLIDQRNKRSGLQIEFDSALTDRGGDQNGELRLIETADGFFRLLWEESNGNPRVATSLWLRSLRVVDDDKLRVGLIRQSAHAMLSEMDTEHLFALAAVCQHENLSIEELRTVLNVKSELASFMVRFLLEYGFLEPKHTDLRRVTLAPEHYLQVLRHLRGKHLLYEIG